MKPWTVPAGASSLPIEVLLVEDNPLEVRLLKEVFAERSSRISFSVVNDGEAALAFLRRESPHQNAPWPDLVVLDLNLPRINGHEVLQAARRDPALTHLPIVVLSSSRNQQDIRAAYAAAANCYITKPNNLDEFYGVVAAIETFWLHTATLPPHRL